MDNLNKTNDMFTIGTIVNTQGVKGHVRIMPQTDDINRFSLLHDVLVVLPKKSERFDIESVSFHKQFVILKLKGINDMTAAERLKGGALKIERAEALPLNDDEYYISDLYGMTVETESGEIVGELTDIMFTGANDVYVVKKTDGKELLLPAIKSCIKHVNVSENKMTVVVLEGL